jgi:hypothetical protein
MWGRAGGRLTNPFSRNRTMNKKTRVAPIARLGISHGGGATLSLLIVAECCPFFLGDLSEREPVALVQGDRVEDDIHGAERGHQHFD